MMFARINLSVVLAVLLVHGLTTATAAAGDLEDVRRTGKLRMLCFPHQESTFVRVDLTQGPMPERGPASRFHGFDVELMQGFAESLGVELEVVPIRQPSYQALIPDLLAGRGHLIASSFSITPEREEMVDFSRPYLETYEVVIARQGSGITSPEDLAGRRAATVAGSKHERDLLAEGIEADNLLRLDFTFDVYLAVAEGDADFAQVDSNSLRQVLPQMQGVEVSFRRPDIDRFGIAVRPDSDLLGLLDAYLAEKERSGGLATLIARHLGDD